MKKILLNLSDELNRELKIYTAQNSFKNLWKAAIHILEEKLIKDSKKLKGGKRTSKNEKS